LYSLSLDSHSEPENPCGKLGVIVETLAKYFELMRLELTRFSQVTLFPQLQQERILLLNKGMGLFPRGEQKAMFAARSKIHGLDFVAILVQVVL